MTKSLGGVLGWGGPRSLAGFSEQVLGKALIGKWQLDGVHFVAVRVFGQSKTNLKKGKGNACCRKYPLYKVTEKEVSMDE